MERVSRIQNGVLGIGLFGLALCLLGAFVDRDAILRSYLFAFVLFSNLSLGGLGLLMLHHMTSGKWGYMVQRYLEAAARTIPLMALFFVPILVGMSGLYPWTQTGTLSGAVAAKSEYLNSGFFIARAIGYFAVWTGMALALARWSRQQDVTRNPMHTRWLRRLSAPGMLVYALTVTFASVDWVMSLEPRWYSSIYGMMFMVAQAVGALALAIVLLRWFAKTGALGELASAGVFHDLGNLLLAFVILWAYMAFSQYLITWSGNLPEEIPWYLRRLGDSWQWVALGLIILHFFVPFALLLARRSKRLPVVLAAIAWGLLVMRVVDTYWLVTPAFSPDRVALHWTDAAALLGVGGCWAAYLMMQLRRASLVPAYDPRFATASTVPGASVG